MSVTTDRVRLLDPKLSLLGLAEGAKTIQVSCLQLNDSRDRSVKPSAETRHQRAAQLNDIADILELAVVWTGLSEAQSISGAPRYGDIRINVDRILEIAQALTGLNPRQVLKRSDRFTPRSTEKSDVADDDLLPADLEANLLRSASSVLASCDLWMILRAAEEIGRPQIGHRCQVAMERLRSFTFRHGPQAAKQIHAAGQAYAEGRLEIGEVAAVLGVPQEDAVFLLERNGFFRSGSKMELDEATRQGLLRKIRDERGARDSLPVQDPRLTRRAVVASQRIEDLDARPWLEPESN